MNTMISPLGHDVPPALRELLDNGDRADFEQALDTLIRSREQHLFRAMGHLARDLHDAVRHLAADIAIDGTPATMGDARKHLQDVLEMSAQAAHRSLDFSEQLRPRVQDLSREADELMGTPSESPAFATSARTLAAHVADFAGACDKGLGEMVEAQSWQDLSGQRVRKVADFLGKVDDSLLELVRLTGTLAGSTAAPANDRVAQDEVDRMLSEFGF
jgi:chemotaxis protein CheZ